MVLTFATDHCLYSEDEAETYTRMRLAQMRRSARVRSTVITAVAYYIWVFTTNKGAQM